MVTPDTPIEVRRWLCCCQRPPVLLATIDQAGAVFIKSRDRYWTVEGAARVTATCPRCGRTQHWCATSADREASAITRKE
jgi:hypothetical protein